MKTIEYKLFWLGAWGKRRRSLKWNKVESKSRKVRKVRKRKRGV